MENLELVDFNDLFVIAVGVSMAYIVIETRQVGKSFFSILSKITSIVQNWVLDYKTKPQQNEEAVISQIQYYLSSGRLNAQTVGALDLVCTKAEDVMCRVKALEEWIKHKMEFHTKTDFLNVISYDSFLYGLFVLFIGALQHKLELPCKGLLEYMLMAILVCLVHCLIFERLEIDEAWKRWCKPNIFTHSIILIAFLIIGIIQCNTPFMEIESGWLAISSVAACFIGFIAYLLATVTANIILLVINLRKIIKLDINAEVKSQKDDIGRYQQELDSIDQAIKDENLVGNFAFDVSEGETVE